MATSRMEVQTELYAGTVDGLTNAHIRRQIQRLRQLKGWTQHDLEQAAGMSPNSMDGLESGLRRINVDTLQKIMEALDSDITEVWPAPNRGDCVHRSGQASDPLSFSRLTEIHSLTGAEASCMFASEGYLDMAGAAAEATSEPALRTLCAINLYDEERERLCREVLNGTDAAPWVTYRHSENGCSLYLCLKSPHMEFWAKGFVERCLSAWLSTPPI